jgi:iron(III) transport system substrate-binding protein
LKQQSVVITRDDRQILDFVARGKYPLAIGPGDVQTNELINKGLPLRFMRPDSLAEGTYMTSGNGSFTVVRAGPNPNATKVYIDYLLSREGQLEWSKASGFASLRRDVPRDHVPDVWLPRDGVEYAQLSSEPYVKLREEVAAFLKPLMGQ